MFEERAGASMSIVILYSFLLPSSAVTSTTITLPSVTLTLPEGIIQKTPVNIGVKFKKK